MITGRVTSNLEAVVRRRVIGGASNREAWIEAVIDTGFTNDLTLPSDLVDALELPRIGITDCILGNGQAAILKSYNATVIWLNTPRIITVLEAAGVPLVGMSLLRDSRLTIEVRDGRAVTIEPIE